MLLNKRNKKIKKKLFHEIGIRINGNTKKEINEAVEYIQKFANNYKGNCEFIIYFTFC